jgi:cysteine synthase A
VGSVDPAGSAMFNYFSKGVADVTPGDSISEGIGQTFVTANVKPAQVDECFYLTDEVIVNMVHYIVRKEGLFLGSSSGANLCAAYLMAKRIGSDPKKPKKVVTILCDSGQKYISKIFNPAFLKERGLNITGKAEDLFPALDKLL